MSKQKKYEWAFQICKSGMITKVQRAAAWNELQSAIKSGKKRPFCRAVDRNGLMYAGKYSFPD
jgi:hypothetical protein